MVTLAASAPTSSPDAGRGSAVVFEDVRISFGAEEVLQGISFELRRGETKVLLGVSGSGKTTILKLATGLIQPDSGRIWTLATEISGMREEDLFEFRRNIGMVFQESALFDSMDVRHNVGYRLYEEHVPEEEIEPRVLEVLRFVELEHTTEMFPSELSGGMRRRVAIARALIARPELLLYDSPTAGLDPVTSHTIVELIVKQRDFYHTSALMVTHRLQDAFTMATHVYDPKSSRMRPLPPGQVNDDTSFVVLREGKVIFDGSAPELAQTENEYIREYIS
ncbi:MAG: ABC transporter ATP-binding protein [Candidatus Korobacteraceae bacterium]